MKKIAICLSGFLRTWEYTKQNFIDVICNDKNIEVDIFIHTFKQNFFEYSAGRTDVIYSEKEIHNMFKGVKNIKKIIIEDRENTLPNLLKKNEKYMHCHNNQQKVNESSDKNAKELLIGVRVLDQLRKIELCNELKKQYELDNNFKYDIVVKARLDVIYLTPVLWQNISSKNMYTEVGCTGGYPHDCVTFGTSEDMDIYSRRYSELDNLIFLDKTDICAHDTLRAITEKNGIALHAGIVRAIVLRNENKVHKIFEGTININDISDLNLRHDIIRSMFPNKICFGTDQSIELDTDDNSNVFLVSSVIHTSKNSLFGDIKRSIFSDDERLEQTIETLKSIKDRVPNAKIVMLEASNLHPFDIYKLYPYIDKIVLHGEDATCNYYCSEHPNKSMGECYLMTSGTSKIDKLPLRRIFKLSGRYSLNDEFDIKKFDNDSTVGAKVLDQCILTVFYSVPKVLLNFFKESMFAFIRSEQQGIDVEHHIYNSGIPITDIEILGCQGKLAVDNKVLTW